MNILNVNPKTKEEALSRYRYMYRLAGTSSFVKELIEKKVKAIKEIKYEKII